MGNRDVQVLFYTNSNSGPGTGLIMAMEDPMIERRKGSNLARVAGGKCRKSFIDVLIIVDYLPVYLDPGVC